jgi:glycosyltransferase involved in cell wall biosynthesis
MRIALLAKCYAPFRVALWNELTRLSDLNIILLSKRAKQRDWKVKLDDISANVNVLDGRQLYFPWLEWNLYFTNGVVTSALEKISPEIIIMDGYDSPGFWAARKWATKHGIPLVFWMESNLLSSRVKGRLAKSIKRRFLSVFDGFYSISRSSTQYLESIGIDKKKVTTGGGLPANPSVFSSAKRLGTSHAPVLLYVGRLIASKGIFNIISALEKLKDRPWEMLVVGDGKARKKIQKRVDDSGLHKRIKLLGSKQPEELPAIYRQADIFLFPTRKDVWGVVVNEAMLSGLYVIGSDKAASCLELIDAYNGQLVSPEDNEQLAMAIEQACQQVPHDREMIRNRALRISPEEEARNIMTALIQASGKNDEIVATDARRYELHRSLYLKPGQK